MIGILEKYPGYSKNGQGSIWNYVYMVGGLIIKIERRRASVAKDLKEWEGLSEKRGKGEGPRAKMPYLLLPPDQNRGGENRGANGVDPGGKEGGATGTRFPVLPRVGTTRGGGATRAGGGGQRWPRRWRCKARKGAREGWAGSWRSGGARRAYL